MAEPKVSNRWPNAKQCIGSIQPLQFEHRVAVVRPATVVVRHDDRTESSFGWRDESAGASAQASTTPGRCLRPVSTRVAGMPPDSQTTVTVRLGSNRRQHSLAPAGASRPSLPENPTHSVRRVLSQLLDVWLSLRVWSGPTPRTTLSLSFSHVIHSDGLSSSPCTDSDLRPPVSPAGSRQDG